MLTDRGYREVFEAAPDAMLIVDAKGVIRDLNPHALALFGWPRNELEGHSVERLIPTANRARHEEHRRHYAEAPRSRPMGLGIELRALRRDGSTFPVEISLSPSKSESGEGHTICAIRDISAWKRMRHQSKLVVRAAENERKRVARELHDDCLQTLVALKIRVKLLADEPDTEKRERARAEIAEQIHDAIRGVKRTIHGLLPPELELHGLAGAIRALIRDLQTVHDFEVFTRLEGVDDGRLDPETALAVYRIVQEALTNVAQHAGVGEATVVVRVEDEHIVAEIVDEGLGFRLPSPGILEHDGHDGVAGMQERAAMVGGEVVIHAAPGKGTTVRATVPMPRIPRSSDNGQGAGPW